MIEFALMVDHEDGKSPEFIPAKDAQHAAEMARRLYPSRPTWTVGREVQPWCYLASLPFETLSDVAAL